MQLQSGPVQDSKNSKLLGSLRASLSLDSHPQLNRPQTQPQSAAHNGRPQTQPQPNAHQPTLRLGRRRGSLEDQLNTPSADTLTVDVGVGSLNGSGAPSPMRSPQVPGQPPFPFSPQNSNDNSPGSMSNQGSDLGSREGWGS